MNVVRHSVRLHGNRNLVRTLAFFGISTALFGYLDAQAQSVRIDRSPPFETTDPVIEWSVDGPRLNPNAFGKYNVTFSHDGDQIGVVHQPNEAWILDATDGTKALDLKFSDSDTGAYSLDFSPTGELAIGRERSVELFSPATGEPIRKFPCLECVVIYSVSFSSKGDLLVYQNISGMLRPDLGRGATIVSVGDSKNVAKIPAWSNVTSVAFSADGRRLLVPQFFETDDGLIPGFRVWDTESWEPVLSYKGEPNDLNLGYVGTGTSKKSGFVVVYGRENTIEMRELETDKVIWSVPLIPPQFAPSESHIVRTELDRATVAPNGEFVISYESPIGHDPLGHVSGGIVVRNADDGSIIAVYDVPGVTDIAIAPDSKKFVYATGIAQTHIALVRLPF